jgi:sulfite reductase (NADPH) flavoprotein alpha-component
MQLLKKILFQTHWLLGITGGSVLAFVGVTGALLSFETELVAAWNDGVVTVPSRAAERLAPPELLARSVALAPERRVMSLDVPFDGDRAPRVGLAPPEATPSDGPRRPQWRYVHPYTAEPLGDVRGETFFRTMRELHRYLAAGETGKQIVGASTAALLVLALSGLYLRWPRNNSWRAWWSIDGRLRGRAFLYRLHAVVGTFVLPVYLVAALTGLTWSYEWYRASFYAVLGAPAPQRGGPQSAPPATGGTVDVVARLQDAWPVIAGTASAMRSATITLPEFPGRPIEVRYLTPDAQHERAVNRIVIDASGNVTAHERFADKPAGARIAASIFPLHRGSYFGVVGTVVMMIASLLMPLFMVTGILMYLARRKRTADATLPAWQAGEP